jgi:hypothetical protein
MLRSKSQHPSKWALALRRETQMTTGQQLRVKCKLPHELPPDLITPLIRRNSEREPYADILGTC